MLTGLLLVFPAPPAPGAPSLAAIAAPATAVTTAAPAADEKTMNPDPPAPPPPPPPPPHDRLVGAGLDIPVGWYSDCRGGTELTHSAAAIDTCLPGRNYFIGHNPGPFSPLATAEVGSLLTYYDGGGGAHQYRVVAARRWYRFDGPPPLAQPDVRAQFQTCLTLDATWDRILDAVEI